MTIINQTNSAEIHSRWDNPGSSFIIVNIYPYSSSVYPKGDAFRMTPDQAREFAATLIRLADAADDTVRGVALIEPKMKGTYTAEDAPLGVIVNNRQVMLLPGMSASVGNTGPGAYDFITYKGFEIVMREDEKSDDGSCLEYNGPFFIGPDFIEVPNIESVKKFLDELSTPIPATTPVTQNDPVEMMVTIAQVDSLFNRWIGLASATPKPSFPEFMRTVQPVFGGNGAITVKWCGMWLCIEKDGYCHS